ncbi:hypothetical protein G6M86_03760 [Agrobacterium tumefaciens]|uniref:Uncharacterized protein n=1 Tax=Agrobacterium tumefaciens TaxID=358 RepID=A0AAJ4N000_AGRTU|nr:hypothetical protein G6M86_03760 [Agrobacterium tumefaciens]
MGFRLSPEAQARAAELRNYQEAKVAHFANLTDQNLVASAKLYMAQMSPMHFAPGEPVYDATMWHVILPELMRRVGEKS